MNIMFYNLWNLWQLFIQLMRQWMATKKSRTKMQSYFLKQIAEDENLSPAIAAIRTLMECLRCDQSTTLAEFIENMRIARESLKKANVSVVSVSSGAELFLRFITLSHQALEQASDFASCRKILLERGEKFISRMSRCRQKIINHSSGLIKDGMVILTHSRSRNVLAAMQYAAQQGRDFYVYVTESQPDCSGRKMSEDLDALQIKNTVILDSAVGYIMEKVNIVMLGAEAVCENGGIINKIGSSTVAQLAKLKNKRVYVFVERFKFLRILPLNNSSLPDIYRFKSSVLEDETLDLQKEHPLVDYTHPSNITLLYSDLGVIPTSAVTEYLIQLYT